MEPTYPYSQAGGHSTMFAPPSASPAGQVSASDSTSPGVSPSQGSCQARGALCDSPGLASGIRHPSCSHSKKLCT